MADIFEVTGMDLEAITPVIISSKEDSRSSFNGSTIMRVGNIVVREDAEIELKANDIMRYVVESWKLARPRSLYTPAISKAFPDFPH